MNALASALAALAPVTETERTLVFLGGGPWWLEVGVWLLGAFVVALTWVNHKKLEPPIRRYTMVGLRVLLVEAWKRPAMGFVVFLVAGLLFAFFFVRDLQSLPNLLLFVLPILLIAGLFYADWKWLKPWSPGQVDAAV